MIHQLDQHALQPAKRKRLSARVFRHACMVFVLSFLAAAVLGACGNDEAEETDPADIVDEAAVRFSELDSARYSLDLGGDAFALGDLGTLDIREVTGAIARPDEATAELSVSFAGAVVDLNLVASGDEIYMSNIFSGEWEQAPSGLAFNPAIIFDEESGVEGALRNMNEIELLGEETVQGHDSHHIRGIVPGEIIQEMTNGAIDDESVDVEVWIESENRDMIQVLIISPDGETDNNWTLQLSDHDEPVDIELPEIG